MKVIVFGSSGFIGNQLVHRLPSLVGVEVIGAARRPLVGCPNSLIFSEDARHGELSFLLSSTEPDAVINAIGLLSGEPADMHFANTVMPGKLALAIADWNKNCRLIHIGSAAEYGPPLSNTPLSEDDVCRPSSIYGATKLAGTQSLMTLCRTLGVRFNVLRLFNIVASQNSPKQVLGAYVSKTLSALRDLEHGPVAMGPLGAVRDFVSIRDLMDLITQLLKVPNDSQLVNVCSGKGVAIRDVIHYLHRQLPRPILIQESGTGTSTSNFDYVVGNPVKMLKILRLKQASSIFDDLDLVWASVGLDHDGEVVR